MNKNVIKDKHQNTGVQGDWALTYMGERTPKQSKALKIVPVAQDTS